MGVYGKEVADVGVNSLCMGSIRGKLGGGDGQGFEEGGRRGCMEGVVDT